MSPVFLRPEHKEPRHVVLRGGVRRCGFSAWSGADSGAHHIRRAAAVRRRHAHRPSTNGAVCRVFRRTGKPLRQHTAPLAPAAAYRAALRQVGVTAGFQWVDGSFVEDAEALRNRPPADIDVVTFAAPPPGMAAHAFRDSYPALLDPRQAKARFGCDAYWVDLGLGAHRPDLLGVPARYWYGLFSHQRASALWKGMLQIELDSDDEVVMRPPPAPGDPNAAQA